MCNFSNRPEPRLPSIWRCLGVVAILAVSMGAVPENRAQALTKHGPLPSRAFTKSIHVSWFIDQNTDTCFLGFTLPEGQIGRLLATLSPCELPCAPDFDLALARFTVTTVDGNRYWVSVCTFPASNEAVVVWNRKDEWSCYRVPDIDAIVAVLQRGYAERPAEPPQEDEREPLQLDWSAFDSLQKK